MTAAAEPFPTTLEAARRLAVARQHLSGPRIAGDPADAVVALLRDTAYVQWDPVTVVAPSHELSLWNRIAGFRPEHLAELLWRDHRAFLHWTPIALIVLTEDLPLYRSLMERYPGSLSTSWGAQRERARTFLTKHAALRRRMLRELAEGPRTLAEFRDHAGTRRDDGEWTFGSTAAQMLYHLHLQGEAVVVGRDGNQNRWGRPGSIWPQGAGGPALSEREADRAAALRAIRALGTATPKEINYHFLRGRYGDLRGTLAELQAEGTLARVRLEGEGAREERYVRSEDLPLLRSLPREAPPPRIALLPPFDNLVHSTARTERLFGFHYVREQFLPKEKRRYGTYVLPILWGDRLIGRIDPRADREHGRLVVNAVHAEPEVPRDREVGARIGEAIADLADFCGLDEVEYPAKVPAPWRTALR